MMYSNKLIASVKANGKILREFKDTIYIPFNSEYSLLLKNLDTRRAIINVYIDGDNMTPNGLVLYGGQEVDLERSIKNNNLNEGNRFKFISRNGAVEKHRGTKLEDGLIRVEYQFEKLLLNLQNDPLPITQHHNTHWWDTKLPITQPPNLHWSWNTAGHYWANSPINKPSGSCTPTMGVAQNSVQPCSSTYLNDVGITVPGSISNQKFSTVSGFGFVTEIEKHSIVLKLLGETADNKIVTEPITVKSKPKCITCGKQNKATAKFCSECGTALQIIA